MQQSDGEFDQFDDSTATLVSLQAASYTRRAGIVRVSATRLGCVRWPRLLFVPPEDFAGPSGLARVAVPSGRNFHSSTRRRTGRGSTLAMLQWHV